MHYLGALRGEGDLIGSDGRCLGRADYDIDGFATHTEDVVGSGELRMAPDVLALVFGRADLTLQAAGGLSLKLRFSAKRLADGSDAAHIDVTAGLPARREWRHR